MAFLRLSVATEISDRRESGILGRCDSCEEDSFGCGLRRPHKNYSSATGRRKLAGRHSLRCFRFLFASAEGRPSRGSLLVAPFSLSSSDRGRWNGVKDGRVCCLDGLGLAHSASAVLEVPESTELVGEATSRGESSIHQKAASNFLKLDDKFLRNTREGKVGSKSGWPTSGSRKAVRKSIPPSASVNRKRSKYIRKNAIELESRLSSVEPESSVEHCNHVLKALEKDDDEKTLVFFDWMKKNGKLKHNIAAYNLVLRALSRKEDWQAAEIMIDEMVSESDCEVNFQMFNILLHVCAKRGHFERGSKWFRFMLEKGVQPGISTFGILMGLYQKCGSLSEAEFTFDQMRSFRLYCVNAYSSMITMYTRLGLYDKSEEIIDLMVEDKVIPNLENWLVQLNAYCQQGKLKEAEMVFNSMQESGFPTNTVAFNTLITGYGKISDMESAQNLFDSLQSNDLKPDETTYRSMIEGYGRTHNYDQANRYYKELKKSGFSPNSSNFYTMINLQANHGDEYGTSQIVADMRAMGCQYSSILSTLLQAYERAGHVNKVPLILRGSFYKSILDDPTSCSILVLAYVRNSLLNEALQILRERIWKDSTFEENLYHTLICSCKESCNYEGAVMIYTQIPKLEAQPNLHIMCSMIDIYSRMNKFSEAEDMYFKLKGSEISLDMIAYSIVARMYVKSGSLKEASLIVDMIDKQKHICPDVYLYRDMLRIYQQCGMLEKSANIFYKIRRSGMIWDEAMYNCVINCCGRALPVDEVSRLFDEMVQRGYTASTITFNMMLDIYGKAGLLKKALKVFQMARKLGLADVISYNTLIAAYGKAKDFKSMQFVIHQMQATGHPISLEAYNCLLDAYGKEGLLTEFNDVLEKMEASKCASDHYTFNIMINIYGKKGWIEDVANVLSEIREHGLEPDHYSYNSLIKAYGMAGMAEEAVGVVKEMREKGLQPDRVTYVNLIAALQRNENYLEAVKWSLWMKQVELSR